MVDQADLGSLALGRGRVAALCDRRQGVGADGLIIIGPGAGPETDFRMTYFNADGGEAEMCGNGARCSVSFAHHLGLVGNSCRFDTRAGVLEGIWHGPEDIEITFREHDLAPFDSAQSLRISGYLVSTGEPHLVIFPETGFSLKELSKTIFVSSNETGSETVAEEKRISFGSWLIHHIGTYLNKNYAHIFPKGINVSFARLVGNSGVFEYRCFERGIYRETFACGTGALAVSFVLRRLNQLDNNPVTAWPHRCRWNNPGAYFLIEEDENGWALHGSPLMLFKGKFQFQESSGQLESAVDLAASRIPQSIRPANLIDHKSAALGNQPELQVNSNCNQIR